MSRPSPAMIWKKLAEYSRTLAAGERDAESRKCLNEIAARYEILAERAAARIAFLGEPDGRD